MTEKEVKIPEPYAGHLLETQKEMEKLRRRRDELLGQVYALDRSLEFLERHSQSIVELEWKTQEAVTNGKL